MGKLSTVRLGSSLDFHFSDHTFTGLLDLGFSWVEIGSITPNPQVGSSMPEAA